jgi:cytoskeletal protein CcmA (bactofilin family)
MGEGSRVEAKVVADAAEIGGSYKGELNVRSLILLDKGRAEGVLDAKTLAVREGAQINGSINAGQAAASHGQPAGHGHTAAAPAGGILGR